MTIAQYLPQWLRSRLAQARSAEGQSCQQEGSTGPSDAAESQTRSSQLDDDGAPLRFPSLLAHVRRSRAVKINVMKGAIMKPVIRYRSQPRIIFRGNYKPNRVIRIRPAHKVALIVRPARAGPQINTYEYATD